MITWNYRVFQEDAGDFVIREVFYDEHGSIIACTANAVEPVGQTLEELAASIADFQAALDLPVLKLADVPTATPLRCEEPPHRRMSSTEVREKLGLAHHSASKEP